MKILACFCNMEKNTPFKKITSLGMDLDEWTNKSCTAQVGTGDNWATIYYIESTEKRKGHASELIIRMKNHYEKEDKRFGSSVAISIGMGKLLKKLNVEEYS